MEQDNPSDVHASGRREYTKGRATPPKSDDETLTRKANQRETRRRTTSMAVPHQRFVSPEVPGFHLCYVNEENVEMYEDAGYVFIDSKARGVVERNEEGGLGSVKSIYAGKTDDGKPYKAYLMGLPEDLWQEDQETLRKKNQAIKDAIRGGKIGRNANDGLSDSRISISEKLS